MVLELGTVRAADRKQLESFEMWALEKDRKGQLDRSCEKWRSVTESQGAEEYPT